MRKGNIKVNNKKKKSSYKMQLGDKVTLNNFTYTATKSKKKVIYKPSKQEKSGADHRQSPPGTRPRRPAARPAPARYPRA